MISEPQTSCCFCTAYRCEMSIILIRSNLSSKMEAKQGFKNLTMYNKQMRHVKGHTLEMTYASQVVKFIVIAANCQFVGQPRETL